MHPNTEASTHTHPCVCVALKVLMKDDKNVTSSINAHFDVCN